MNHATPQVGAPVRTFTQLLSSTRRGARLARLLAVTELRSWGAPQDLTERAELVVAELAANAALHGRVPGRCFRLTLHLDPPTGRLRVEISDAHGDLHPHIDPLGVDPDALSTSGRGMALVAALADHWDTVPYPPSGKTVRAVLTAPAGV
ncbi:ATP-binding protein [Streptomyces lucensis JCM 4490]|uniref:ATP-binding protein n=1 Tax=Streptomyces lucensis JCM 4490 TaxID=1306176 RepID=A0A918J4P3_9ACTN|nr:ATP-binding protein [Streptomyces lucensis]GGW47479.1 ATP-binding protein [Streptomyces lucensis JCM 4490]